MTTGDAGTAGFTYDFHGLVELVIDKSLGEKVAQRLDRQIGYFRVGVPTGIPQRRIRVRAYADFPQSEPHQRLQTSLGISETPYGIDFAREGWALQIEPDEVTLYITGSIPPVGPYIQLLLSPQGVSQVHAASLERDGSAYLFPGFGGAGKTALTATMVKSRGFRFMGDDIAWVKGDATCLAFPRPLMLFPYHREVFPEYFKEERVSLQVARVSSWGKHFVNKNAPFRDTLKSLAERLRIASSLRRAIAAPESMAAVTPEHIFGASAIATQATIAGVVFLQRYGGSELQTRTIDHDELVERLMSIVHQEWWSYWLPIMLTAGAGKLKLDAYYAKTAATISDAFAGHTAHHLLIPYRAPGVDVADRVEQLIAG
jgi:hypothetical protein